MFFKNNSILKRINTIICLLCLVKIVFATTFHSNYKTINDTTKAEKQILANNTREQQSHLVKKRLELLNEKTPMDLRYNSYVENYISSYLGQNKKLISQMLCLVPHYFLMFESMLDKYDLPMELKYLAIVESALNPRARSRSGARGLWQFMYPTGKMYNLDVTSYIDERQDPYKSTEAACQYFVKLYKIFGDWNLVLAAYNGGPGYLSRTIAKTGLYDYWELRPYLRKETRGYIPTFIAINYVMNYYKEYDIIIAESSFLKAETDTIMFNMQASFSILSDLLCISKATIMQLNPSIKKEIVPKNTIITLPVNIITDFVRNEQAIYSCIEAIEQKKILLNEERFVYVVQQGDYLGKIAEKNGVAIIDIKKWNNLRNDKLSIGKKLVLFVKDNFISEERKNIENIIYIVKEGDTLWDIAKKYNGLSVYEIKQQNNLNSDHLKPGEKLLLPTG